MIRVRLFPVAFLVLTIPLLGCSGDKLAPARLSGEVTYKGQPIKAGKLQFHTPEGIAYDAQINPADGTYTARDLPVGEMVVTIETESINPEKQQSGGRDANRRMRMQMQRSAPGTPNPSDHYVKIPAKYADPKTSPLKVTLERGSQEYNIPLAD